MKDLKREYRAGFRHGILEALKVVFEQEAPQQPAQVFQRRALEKLGGLKNGPKRPLRRPVRPCTELE